MNRSSLVVWMLVLSVIGLIDAWYLADSALSSSALFCDIAVLDGCNTVAQSPYSRLFDIPLGVYGVGFYGIFFGLATFLFASRKKIVSLLLLAWGILGVVASVAFLYVQFVLIQALCIYCLLSAFIAFVLGFMVYANYKKRSLPVPEPVVIP